jgi:mevalonate kinase
MTVNPEVYYAKIMLFGEYSVICNSMGLTIPYIHYKGELSFFNAESYTNQEFALSSNKTLKDYFIYLNDLFKEEVSYGFDLDRLKKDLTKGLYFESTIPQGYGIGSSGAVCAALFTEYTNSKGSYRRYLNPDDIVKLKNIFSKMESYFHGVSSGIDPLLCYIKYPLLIKGQNNIETIGIPRNKLKKGGGIFLINSGNPGKTGPLVDLFINNCKTEDFKAMVYNDLIPVNNTCIEALTQGNSDQFFENLKLLSALQLSHFQPMIPEDYKDLWKIGLESDLFKLKLCGSGGGGFLLGFTGNYVETADYLRNIRVEPILVYKN